MLCISPTSASSASLPTALRSGIDAAMFLPLLIVGKAFSYITGSKRPIKDQKKSQNPGRISTGITSLLRGFCRWDLQGLHGSGICGGDSASTCMLVCAPSSVSIVRAALTASRQFKKVDSALSLFSDLTLASQGEGEKWQVTLHCHLPLSQSKTELAA